MNHPQRKPGNNYQKSNSKLTWLVESQVRDISIVFGIAGHKGEVVFKGSCSDDEIESPCIDPFALLSQSFS